MHSDTMVDGLLGEMLCEYGTAPFANAIALAIIAVDSLPSTEERLALIRNISRSRSIRDSLSTRIESLRWQVAF